MDKLEDLMYIRSVYARTTNVLKRFYNNYNISLHAYRPIELESRAYLGTSTFIPFNEKGLCMTEC